MTGRVARTRAHTATQLAAAMGLSADQLARARAAGLVPPTDMATPRWSGSVVDDLVARREQITSDLPDDADERELMSLLGVEFEQWRRGREAGVIPGPDRGAYWTRPVARELAERAEQIRDQIPPAPLGATRCAELLAELTGLAVWACDVEHLAAADQLAGAGEYKGCALYDVAALRKLPDTPDLARALAETVAERQEWLGSSVRPEEAAIMLGCHPSDLPAVARERGITPGRFGRYGRAELNAVTSDEAAMEEIRRSRLVGANQAATVMEIRRSDFDVAVELGRAVPAGEVEMRISRRLTITVPLYRLGDLEDLLAEPPEPVDWEVVRGARPGEPSPLRQHLSRPAARRAPDAATGV